MIKRCCIDFEKSTLPEWVKGEVQSISVNIEITASSLLAIVTHITCKSDLSDKLVHEPEPDNECDQIFIHTKALVIDAGSENRLTSITFTKKGETRYSFITFNQLKVYRP